jgi:hypothetical protein
MQSSKSSKLPGFHAPIVDRDVALVGRVGLLLLLKTWRSLGRVGLFGVNVWTLLCRSLCYSFLPFPHILAMEIHCCWRKYREMKMRSFILQIRPHLSRDVVDHAPPLRLWRRLRRCQGTVGGGKDEHRGSGAAMHSPWGRRIRWSISLPPSPVLLSVRSTPSLAFPYPSFSPRMKRSRASRCEAHVANEAIHGVDHPK